MNSEKKISGAPYLYKKTDTSAIMRDVIIALMPCLGVGIWLYGIDVLITAAICVFSCVVFEVAWEKAMKKPVTAKDLSAVVTGLIVALNLPAAAPGWLAVTGSFIAIILVKQLFGGIGRNFVNPALTAILCLRLGFPALMTAFPVNEKMLPELVAAASGANGPTVLHLFRLNAELPADMAMFTGFKNGPVGQACCIAVLLGFAYLLAKRVVSPVLSLSFFATVAAVSAISGFSPVFQLCAGGTLFFGVFMANDYATTPMTSAGRMIFGMLLGLMTMFFRAFSGYEDGIAFALLFANILAPHIDGITMPKPFGKRKGGELNG